MEDERMSELLMRCLRPSVFDPTTVKRKKLDVPYGPLPEQLVDVYYPETGEGPWPLIIYVHGGGWNIGTKRECALPGVIGALDHGYAIISVDYRLAPAVKFPEFMFDVKTAVRWARANAAEFSFDPERFAIMGDSAGAQLSLMVAFADNHPECEGTKYGWEGVSSSVKAVVDMYGPTVLDAYNHAWVLEAGAPDVIRGKDPTKAPLDDMMGFFTPDRDLLPFISPIAYVHKDIPPVLIMQGAMDSIVPRQHSLRLAERITEVCGPDRVELKIYPDRVHSDRDFLTNDTAETVVPFLDKYLKYDTE